MNTTTAASRKTAQGEKIYVHTNCSCAKVNGKILKGIDTVEAAEAFAARHAFPLTLCKTSVVTPADTDEVDEDELDEDEELLEEGFEGGGEPEFTVLVDNTDQYGKQRRDAVAALVEKLGAELTFKGIKNKHRTGNDGFQVEITKAPAHLQPLVEAFLNELVDEVAEVVDEAKSEGLAEGWDANTRQKHYKKAARTYIVRKGAELAARLG